MTEAGLRLLLVDDEPMQRLLLERILRNAGYVVDTATDGKEALAKIVGGQFQILITDWEMPGMDGATLCEHVRQADLPTYLYIVLLTGHRSTDNVVRGLRAGADDYVRKPADEAELLARLNTARRILRLEQSLREANQHIQTLSVRDPLVGTFNRRYLDEQLLNEVQRAQRHSRPLSVAMADLDRFKAINDDHGHETGDEVLRRFADIVRSTIRQSDWLARYGGEEFVLVLPETALAGALTTAEKVRAKCCSARFATSAGDVAVTVSFGVAQLTPLSGNAAGAAAALLRNADAALYTSKREGRNRVTGAPASP